MPLENITVLDLTRVLSGPYCTMMLADMGARVIKIEQPGNGRRHARLGSAVSRRRERVLPQHQPQQGERHARFQAARRPRDPRPLLAKADVLVENFRPGTLTKLGLDYESLAARHPRLVYCSISGFGHTGPRTNEAGYDAVMQGEGGLMSITGQPKAPGSVLASPSPTSSSGMFAAQGVTPALFARERTGRGQAVDIAMLDSVTALLTYQAGIYFATGSAPAAPGQSASDDRAVRDVRGVGRRVRARRRQRRAVAAVLRGRRPGRRRALRHQPPACDRLRGAQTFDRRSCGRETRAYWIERLTAAGVPCGSVRDLHEVFADPQVSAREMVVDVEHAKAGHASSARHAAEAFGHASCGPHRAADSRRAHRGRPYAGSWPDRRRDLGASRERYRLMEISEVRRRVRETIDRAKRQAAERRARVDEAAREYAVFLEQIAVPLFRQVANALKAHGYSFHGLHAGRQRAPDVGQKLGRLHRTVSRHGR